MNRVILVKAFRRIWSRSLQWMLLCGCIGLVPHALYAQLRFDWNGQEPDIALYRTVEECLGVAEYRVIPAHKDTILSWWKIGEIRETLPDYLAPVVNHVARETIAAARRCSAKFTVDGLLTSATTINESRNAFKLLVVSGRMPEALEFARRWLDTFGSVSDTARNVFASEMAQYILGVDSLMFDDIRYMVSLMDTTTFWTLAWDLMYDTFLRAKGVRDSASIWASAEWLLNSPNWIGEAALASPAWAGQPRPRGSALTRIVGYVHYEKFLAAIKNSTGLYFDVMDSLYRHYRIPIPANGVNRTKATPIVADAWFPEKPDTARPTPGRVSLLKSVGDNEFMGPVGGWVKLKRMLREMPELEVTLVMTTRGSFGTVAPPTPEKEALLIDSLFRRSFHLPVTLAIHYNDFWRISDPDRRRINIPGPNEAKYPTWSGFPVTYLVDRDGYIIKQMGRTEPEQIAFIKALLNQRAQ